MISLRLKVDPLPIYSEEIVRLCVRERSDLQQEQGRDVVLRRFDNGVAEYDAFGMTLRVYTDDPALIDGDVIMLLPGSNSAHRLIREGTIHNSFLVTEQCDQLCVMCSQPPKRFHSDFFSAFTQAALLSPKDSTIGITGGEPLLHKARLFELLLTVKKHRSDVHFHVLTNAQHFDDQDTFVLSELRDTVTWGIPLYSVTARSHDAIVGKVGAFERLMKSLALLAGATARIELRTVVINSNVAHLLSLSEFISVKLFGIEIWAIMQMENIGYGRMNWKREFADTSVDFSAVSRAIDLSVGRNIQTILYNFPLCSVPLAYRQFCASSISDWKRRYFPRCNGCSLRNTCGGFFEWSPLNGGFTKLEAT